ncbi:MAG: hypothetical protein AAF743_01985, partial [Planctomycetota bacterium]
MTITSVRVVELSSATVHEPPFAFEQWQVTPADLYTGPRSGGDWRGPDYRPTHHFVEIEADGVVGRYGPIEHHEVQQIGGGIGALLLGTDAREVGKLHDRMRRHDRHGLSG